MENTNISRNNSWLEGTNKQETAKQYTRALPRRFLEALRRIHGQQGKAKLFHCASGNVRVRATVAVFRYGSLECSSASSRTLRAKVARRDDYDDNDDDDDDNDDDDDDDDAVDDGD
ncbi:hypothetical protein V1477_018358 [Vespula maculifrons]|uniref:Uncharacterized protein n=1 Tax=Vespula maculifrons TaxID=7453 RepID=A0ABD2B117_VESMC